jgi:CRISPR-associated protein Cas2
MFVVIAYDVVCDKRRNRLAKLLLGFGERVNYSVFECELRERQYEGLQRDIMKLIDPDEDHVRYYELCVDCKKRIRSNGRTVEFKEEPLVFV